ncbi:unnamed protein product [Meganyctiphanes norvegica]|uniref:Regulatory protein zeste n=1 Tax=Meganyctiphanes norvegica TaxID=48144 RepID=A0AAV2QSH9_MEGNR
MDNTTAIPTTTVNDNGKGIVKRHRKANFTIREVECLIEEARKNIEYIQGNFDVSLGRTSNKRKLTWMAIAEKVNGVSNVKRDANDISKKFKLLKNDDKKNAARQRNHMNGTGGGPVKDEKLSELDEQMMYFVPDCFAYGFKGDNDLESNYEETPVQTLSSSQDPYTLDMYTDVEDSQLLEIMDNQDQDPLDTSSTLTLFTQEEDSQILDNPNITFEVDNKYPINVLKRSEFISPPKLIIPNTPTSVKSKTKKNTANPGTSSSKRCLIPNQMPVGGKKSRSLMSKVWFQ